LAPHTDCFIDRFEGDVAVLIAGDRQILVPVDLLPDGAAEGDHLSISFAIDSRARQETCAEIQKLQERLSKNGKESDSQ